MVVAHIVAIVYIFSFLKNQVEILFVDIWNFMYLFLKCPPSLVCCESLPMAVQPPPGSWKPVCPLLLLLHLASEHLHPTLHYSLTPVCNLRRSYPSPATFTVNYDISLLEIHSIFSLFGNKSYCGLWKRLCHCTVCVEDPMPLFHFAVTEY